jgi:ribonuclease P protein component
MIRHTFSKQERLKGKRLIEYTFKQGHTIYIPPFKLWYCFKDDVEPTIHIHSSAKILLSVGVSKRHFKKAVQRNRIKRLIKEAYRLQKHILVDNFKIEADQLYCFVQYTSSTMPVYKEIFGRMEVLLKKIATIIHAKNLDHT